MLSLEPLEIRFMQDSICRNFQNRNSVNSSIDRILSGTLDYRDFPQISVALINGKYYSHDNRRLYMFRVLQLKGKLQVIDVHVSGYYNHNKFTTINDGLSIRVRGAITKPHTRTNLPIPLPTQQRATAVPQSHVQQRSTSSFSQSFSQSTLDILRTLSIEDYRHIKRLHPSEIRFHCNSCRISEGDNDWFARNFKRIAEGCEISEQYKLKVYRHLGKWYAIQPLHLYLCRLVESLNVSTTVNIEIVDKPFFNVVSTTNDGDTLQIQGASKTYRHSRKYLLSRQLNI